MIALVLREGARAAFRLQQRRDYDFRRGQWLGRGDHIVLWTKPARPAWMDEAQDAQLPATRRIREVRFRVTQPGYRSQEIIVATTRADAEQYSKAMIADL